MRPARSRATTPSRMPCSMASRSDSSAAMSEKARSLVCRWTRREMSHAASAPTARAPPAYASSPGIAWISRARTLS